MLLVGATTGRRRRVPSPSTPSATTWRSRRTTRRTAGRCAGGQLTNPNRSAADPLFYLLHSQIDREWAAWQQAHNRHSVVMGGVLTFPAPAHYDNNNWNTPGNVADANFRQKGSFLNDGLWPWDGTTDGPAGTPNQ
ncbi:MAG: tyrosinase family protein, partial [Gammaproteobacteria bacterium]